MARQLIDLHNHLFAQLERINDEDLEGEELSQELDRSKAVCSIAKQITANSAIALKAAEFKYESGGKEALPGIESDG